jgi:hypothetical protein
MGQVAKFVHWQERPMFLSKAEVRPRSEYTTAAIPLGGFVHRQFSLRWPEQAPAPNSWEHGRADHPAVTHVAG